MVTVWVVPAASRSEIKGRHGDALKVRVTAPPEAGKANAEACRVLSEEFGVATRVLSGTSSRTKQILLRGADVASARAVLSRYGFG